MTGAALGVTIQYSTYYLTGR